MSKSLNKNPWHKLRRKVGTAIAQYEMISAGDRLLIGVSGGKDSMVLMKVLAELKQRSPVKFELFAATFHPEFKEFDVDLTRKWAAECKVPYHQVQLDVESIIKEKSAEERPCVLCSRLRRGHLYKLALELNCNKLVLGQHLDDIAVSLLIGLFRGQGLTTMGPNVPTMHDSIRVIRPLAMTPEADIINAASTLDMSFSSRCPYSEQLKTDGDRVYFENLLTDLSKRIPEVRELMLRSMSDVRPEYLLDKKFLSLK